MIAMGTNATNKDLGPASDSKMAAAVNMHTFELLIKNRKFWQAEQFNTYTVQLEDFTVLKGLST